MAVSYMTKVVISGITGSSPTCNKIKVQYRQNDTDTDLLEWDVSGNNPNNTYDLPASTITDDEHIEKIWLYHYDSKYDETDCLGIWERSNSS